MELGGLPETLKACLKLRVNLSRVHERNTIETTDEANEAAIAIHTVRVRSDLTNFTLEIRTDHLFSIDFTESRLVLDMQHFRYSQR